MSLYKENDYYIVTAVNKTIYILHEGTLKAKYAKDEYHKLTNDGYATILGKTRRVWIFPVAHANYHIRNVYNAHMIDNMYSDTNILFTGYDVYRRSAGHLDTIAIKVLPIIKKES